jgi:transposase
MKRFIEGESREQISLLPVCLEDTVAEDNPVRVIEACIEPLNSEEMGVCRSGESPW